MCRLAGWRSVVPVRMRRQRVTSLNQIHFRSVGWLRTYCFRVKPNIWLSSWVKREPNVRTQHFCYRDQQLFRFRRFVSQFRRRRPTCQPREKFWRDKQGATERSEPTSEGGPGVLPREISKTCMANGAIYVIPELYL